MPLTVFSPFRRHPWLPLVTDWLPALAWMALIFGLSHQPSLPHPGRQMGLSDYLFDYTAHAFMFGVLTVLIWRVMKYSLFLRMPGAYLHATRWAAASAALYAMSDEVHQAFVPGRQAKVNDWLADLVGILVAVVVINLYSKLLFLRRYRQHKARGHRRRRS